MGKPNVILYTPARLVLPTMIMALVPGPATAQPGASLYTIPVVFHVLHQNGPENINEAQVADAIAILNSNFDMPTWPVEPPFDAIAADMDISFVLASTAPNGSPTNGIDRIETALTNDAGSPSSYVNAWPRNRYLNIWTVRSLATPNISYISHLPGLTDTEPCGDGVMLFHNYVGSIGTASEATKRTLTQAVGRFLDLKLVYEDPIGAGPCADDEVSDTPPCTVTVLCNGAVNPCAAIVANEHNFMSSPYCSNMFTLGQRERVHACLNSTVAQRNELASGIVSTSPDCSTTSIPDAANSMAGVTAFPVPFADHIFLKGLRYGRYHAELQDPTGRTIAFMPYVADDAPLDLRMPIATGSYLLKLGDGRSTHVMRVVKE